MYSAGAENKHEYSSSEERFLIKNLSSVEFSFIEPNIKYIHADPYLPCHIKFNQKRFGIKKFAVNIHWIFTLMIYFLQMYENMPRCGIVQFSGWIFETKFILIHHQIFKPKIYFP